MGERNSDHITAKREEIRGLSRAQEHGRSRRRGGAREKERERESEGVNGRTGVE